MDFDTRHGDERADGSTETPNRRRMFRAAFYYSSGIIILTALLVALVSASAPPPENARIVVIDSTGTKLPSDDTIQALRQACARERIEARSWHWTLFRPAIEIALRCVVRNRDTNLTGTLLWRFSDFRKRSGGPFLGSTHGNRRKRAAPRRLHRRLFLNRGFARKVRLRLFLALPGSASLQEKSALRVQGKLSPSKMAGPSWETPERILSECLIPEAP